MNRDEINKRGTEILFDRLIEGIDSLGKRVDELEERMDTSVEDMRENINRIKTIAEDMKMILDYKETIISLGKNASSQGVINLINEVDELKTFMNKQKERQELITKIIVSLMIPLGMFGLGVVWYIFNHYLMK